MVLNVLYALSLIGEFTAGLYILYQMYPQMRRDTPFVKGILIIVYLMCVFLYINNGWNSYISNLYIILNSLIIAAVYCIFFKIKYSSAFLWEFLYRVNLAFLKLPVLIVLGIMENKTLGQVNRYDISIGEVTWSILICIFLCVLIRSGQSWWMLLKGYITEKRWHILLFAIFQWCLLTYNMWLGLKGFQTVDLVINIVIIICIALGLQYFMLYISYQKVRSKSNMLETAQDLTQQHNAALQEMYNRNNRKLHDVKHHMLSIAGYLENGDINSARKQVDEYLGDLNKTGHQVWTGLTFLDFIINYKKSEMDEKDIDFSLQFELFDFPLEESEMGVVLGNLLDNAIEAAEQCPEGKRKIHMCMQSINHVNLLYIRNSCVVLPQQVKGSFISSKKNQNIHGLGLESVKRIVERNHGSIEFQYNSEQFEVTILL